MDPLMCDEITHSTKRLSTLRTMIWLFPSVDSLVFLEITHSTKSLSTLRTLM